MGEQLPVSLVPRHEAVILARSLELQAVTVREQSAVDLVQDVQVACIDVGHLLEVDDDGGAAAQRHDVQDVGEVVDGGSVQVSDDAQVTGRGLTGELEIRVHRTPR